MFLLVWLLRLLLDGFRELARVGMSSKWVEIRRWGDGVRRGVLRCVMGGGGGLS